MELRKEKEVEYYDKRVEESREEGDFEGFTPQILSSFRFFYKLLGERCSGKLILDYGCGNGIHSFFPLKMRAEKVIGIDLSEKSLAIAGAKAVKEGFSGKVEFLKMDCEKTEFPDNYFDIILDAGTFSSLDLNVVFPELVRILKPGGSLVGIETFGHNPLTNLKRKLNKLTGKRTSWATEHIFQEKDIKEAGNYFKGIKVYYFHLISWLAFPLLQLPGGRVLLKFLEFLDNVFFALPFLKKYAFKVVFVFEK